MKGMPMPKVSVLMPVYKTKEEYLRAAIESILTQTFTDFEFLILDDCPEDDRGAVVRSYKDKRIKYFKNNKNLGISASRNKLINMAKGEYLAVFDHDDISLPERLTREAAYLDEHPETGVVASQVKNIIKQHNNLYDVEVDIGAGIWARISYGAYKDLSITEGKEIYVMFKSAAVSESIKIVH